jgi:hypothetical protein
LVLLFSVPQFAFQSVSRAPVASSTKWDESHSEKLKQKFKETATAVPSTGSSARRTLGKGARGEFSRRLLPTQERGTLVAD